MTAASTTIGADAAGQRKRRHRVAPAAAAALLLLLPQPLPEYWRSVVVLLLVNVILVQGYRLITTMGGWSFAHVAIMGLGAYTMALLTRPDVGWPFWPTLLLGPLVAAGFALLIAYPVLRTRHYY